MLDCGASRGRIGDDIPFTISAAPGLGEPGGHLALTGMAALLGRPLFCRLFLFFIDFLKINFCFYLSMRKVKIEIYFEKIYKKQE